MSIVNSQQLIQRLKAQILIFEEEPVEIVLLADVDSFSVFGVTFAGGKKSATISVPRYYAACLYTNGKARFNQPHLYTQLLNGYKQKTPNFKLQELRDNLLVETLSILEDYNKNALLKEYISEQERNRIQETFYNLSYDRLKKILRDITLNDYKKVEKYLDEMEKPVLKEIYKVLQIYLEIRTMKPM